MSFVFAAELGSLWPGEMRGLSIATMKVLLVNLGGRVLAYEDRCAHLGIPLSHGRLDREGVVTCSAHGWQYDAGTGAGCNPRGVSLRPLPVRIDRDQIWVDVGRPGDPDGSSAGGRVGGGT
jgi:toluene monooxygenase system ferredoxin subunit